MPYIIKADRKQFDPHIEELVDAISNHGFAQIKAGNLNYVVSKIVWNAFDKKPSYSFGNELMGALECIKQEFYRRKLAPYEDKKIEENGDVV
jgi:hypothetical protein